MTKSLDRREGYIKNDKWLTECDNMMMTRWVESIQTEIKTAAKNIFSGQWKIPQNLMAIS